MSRHRSRVRYAVFGAVALTAVGGVSYWLVSGFPTSGDDAALPAIDLGASESQVTARIEQARNAVRDDPDSARAWAELGQVLHAHDFHAQAVGCYSRASMLDPADYRWPYLAALAQGKLDLAAARPYFEAAAALEPSNPAFYVNFGDLLLKLGQTAPAETQYRRALEMHPADSHARYGLARIALLADDLETARALLEAALEAAPRHGEVRALLAQVYARAGDTEAAEQEERLARASATTTRPDDPVIAAMEALAVSSTAHARRGSALARQGDFAAAEREFRRVLAIRSGHPRDHANLGGALARQGRTKEAIAQFRQGLEIAPEDVDLLNNLGLTLAEAGDLAGGEAYLRRAVDLDPTFYQAHQNLGLVRERQGDLKRAVEHYREALRLNPASADAHTNLGSALAGQGRIDAAVDAWSAALAIDPSNLAARYNLSVARVGQGRHAEAVALLREGARRAPRSSRFLSLLAWELATAPDPALRDGAEALALARRLFEAAPTNPERGDLLAAALAENERFDEAARAAEAALARVPDPSLELAAAIKRRAALYRQSKPYRQAQ